MIEQLRKVEHFTDRLEEVRRQALLDPLTGLVSRRAGEAVLQHHLASSTGTAVVLIRLCDLKEWNERVGHSGGDEILKAFSLLLAKHTNGFDMICRWGGATFVLLANNSRGCDALDPQALNQNLSTPLGLNPEGPVSEARMTVASGLAHARPGDDLASLLSRAETALREALPAGEASEAMSTGQGPQA
jgi:diguanylate cyclase (GGDEF)-like protein